MRWRQKSPASRLFTQPFIQAQIKKKSNLHVTDLGAGNSPRTSEFPAQMASCAEKVSIWCRHHEPTPSHCIHAACVKNFISDELMQHLELIGKMWHTICNIMIKNGSYFQCYAFLCELLFVSIRHPEICYAYRRILIWCRLTVLSAKVIFSVVFANPCTDCGKSRENLVSQQIVILSFHAIYEQNHIYGNV